MNHIQRLPREQRRAAAKYLAKEAQKYPAHLIDVPREAWPESGETNRVRIFRNREYLVQVFQEPVPCLARLSISRTCLTSKGGWQQDIPWEDLQRLKNEAGYGEFDAVEVYPRKDDVINVANMRHLFVMAGSLQFAWRK